MGSNLIDICLKIIIVFTEQESNKMYMPKEF